MPCSPDPAATARPSSVKTFVWAPTLNRAVGASWPGPDRLAANPTPSLEPRLSSRSIGWRACRAAFTARAPDHAAADHQGQGRQVVGVDARLGLLQRPHHRLGERVADDREHGHPLPRHRAPQLVGVEVAALERHDGPAEEQRLHRAHHPRAVHQRRGGQVHRRPARRHHPGRGPTGVLVAVGDLLAEGPVDRLRRGPRTGRRCATSRPSASRSCRPCRGTTGRRPTVRCGASARGRRAAPRSRAPRRGGGTRRRPARPPAAGGAGRAPPRPARRATRGTPAPRRRSSRADTRAPRPGTGS